MIRAIFTLIKIGIVVALAIWIAERPGTITIDWMQYKMTLHIGIFLLAMLIIVIIGIIVFSVIKTGLDMPKNIARYKDITNKDKGLKALTIGLTAVAAGDTKNAVYQAKKASIFLKEGAALPKLLEAQAARLDGRELDASRCFMELMDDKNAKFLGVRGLLQSALDNEDYSGALELSHHALELHPKQGWVLQIAYDLEIKSSNWDGARKILYRTEKSGIITSVKANSDRVAMYLAEAFQAKSVNDEALYYKSLNKAYKLDKNFVPSVQALAQMYLDRGKHKAAVSMIEKAWKGAPHPDLAKLWEAAYALPKNNDLIARVRWFEKLLSFNPQSVEGLQALANVLIQENLWAEARKYLSQAQGIRPNVNLYKLWARLEDRATHDEESVRNWLKKAADAPRERVWICSETGRVYDHWIPISDQGLFNTIIWDFPQATVTSSGILGNRYISSQLLAKP